MTPSLRVLVALSGGVDSAVTAWLLVNQGYRVECLHMSNWDDDDGYCDAAADLQDARSVCDQLGLTLHRVDFSREYRETVFSDFLRETCAGRTPNPDVLCNREIKFGLMLRYARRLGADRLATGHYAQLGEDNGQSILLKGRDQQKDQSYFLHAVDASNLVDVLFPLGDRNKAEVRDLARKAGLSIADKRDSTGICFIGERPFGEFLGRYIEPEPGPIVTETGTVLGQHQGLHLYTLGQRKGLRIGGVVSTTDAPWYVAAKRRDSNELVIVQGRDHRALLSDWLETSAAHWIGPVPAEWQQVGAIRCHAKTRYRQADQPCSLIHIDERSSQVEFDQPQRAVTPGQYAVFYLGNRCLGGAQIERVGRRDVTDISAAGAS